MQSLFLVACEGFCLLLFFKFPIRISRRGHGSSGDSSRANRAGSHTMATSLCNGMPQSTPAGVCSLPPNMRHG